MKKLIALGLSISMLLFLLAGCVKMLPAEPYEKGGDPAAADTGVESEPEVKDVTDVLGRTVSIPLDVERVVVTFNIEEYLAVGGEGAADKLVGFSHGYWEGRREDAWEAFTEALPQLREIKDVGYNDTISPETIISLTPDVVIMSSPVNYSYIEPYLELMEESGIKVVFVDYHSQALEMHTASNMVIGEVMNREERAAEISEFYSRQMAQVTDRIATLNQDDYRPRVYMEFSRGADNFGNTWSEKMWGAMIRTCGGENIAAGMEGNSVEIAPEKIIAADPEVIIFAASPQTDIDSNIVLGYGADGSLAAERLSLYMKREGWAGLTAVKDGRMGALYHDLSRHIFDFAGAQFMAKMIHPELFADLEPEENLAEFFELYMPTELKGAWTVCLK